MSVAPGAGVGSPGGAPLTAGGAAAPSRYDKIMGVEAAFGPL